MKHHGKGIHISAILPPELHKRLIRRAAQETADRGRRVTCSDIVRWSVEDYLDMWEGATFVPSDGSPASHEADSAAKER